MSKINSSSSGKRNLTLWFLSFPDQLSFPIEVSQYSFWQNTLTKAFPGSVEVIRDRYMLEVQKNWMRTMYYTKLQHHTYIKIWTLSREGISAHHGIFLEIRKHEDLYKSWCLRPAVTFCLPFPPSQKQTRVNFDSAIRSPVPQRDEERRCKGEDRPPLTSVPLHLLQQRSPCQTEGWAELHPGATRAAPGSFGFDDTETSKKTNIHI